MAKIITGDRVGKDAKIGVGACACIFDEMHSKILLTRRADNGQWCLPSGGIEPGESISECCIREVLEETGLHVEVVSLIGLYTSPHEMVVYADGNRVQVISPSFFCRKISGTPKISDETLEIGFFNPNEIAGMGIMENHKIRIRDAFEFSEVPFIR